MAPRKNLVGVRENNDAIRKVMKYKSGGKKHLILHFA